MHQSPSANSQKTAKLASPRFADHTPQPMPGCFPHASDPHTGHIIIQPQSDHAPAEASGWLAQTYAPSRFTWIPRSNDVGWPGVGDGDAAMSGGGAARRLRVGLKAGPGAAARLEAGSCERGFACIFWVCAVLPHQACTGGSVFFCRRLSKAGLSGPAGRPASRAQPDARYGIVRPRSPKGAAGPKPTDRPVRHTAGRPKGVWAPVRRIR